MSDNWMSIATAPRDGTEIIVAVCIATVWIVRNAWYRDAARLRAEGNTDFTDDDTGWWAYRNSVTQEQLEGIYEPTHWISMPALPES